MKKAVEQIKNETDRVDILDCSAAIGMYTTDIPSDTSDKKYALDRHFAVNNVGHAILTEGLLPLIKKTADKTGDARIVIMASNLHFSAPSDVKFESIEELNTSLGPTLQYNRSKLGNVLYAKKLDRMIRAEGTYEGKIFVNCIHPGVVKTAQQDGVVEAYQKIVKDNVGEGIIGQAASSALAGEFANTRYPAQLTNHELGANQVMRAVLEKDSPEG